MGWTESLVTSLKAAGVRLVVYIPDEVLNALVRDIEADSFFTSITATREEEAVGIVAGAAMGGMQGVVLMQSSGLGNSVNALASLVVPYQLPVVLIISERGRLGEFNSCQVPMSWALSPILDSLSIINLRIRYQDEVAFLTERTVKQAKSTHAPAALILSPQLTGGKQHS